MAKQTESDADRADRLEGALVQVWAGLQNAGGARAEMQEAMDDAQGVIEEEFQTLKIRPMILTTTTMSKADGLASSHH